LAEGLGERAYVAGHCDVTDAASVDAVFADLENKWGKLDFVVHCIAFSDKDELDGRYVDTSEGNFTKSMLISCYSFTAIAQRAEKMMPDGGSLVTLTYYGAEKWMPHYNVMGVAKAALEASVRYLAADLGEKNIRVNAISAGPIKTLAASGIGDFRYILKWNELNSPLRRTVTTEEVGETGAFLIDLEFEADIAEAARSDDLSAAIDYGKVVAETRKLFVDRRYKLVEAAASALADDLLRSFPAMRSVFVRVRKVNPPIPERLNAVGVELHKQRDASHS
jgi:dihydroneopterin aldolase